MKVAKESLAMFESVASLLAHAPLHILAFLWDFLTMLSSSEQFVGVPTNNSTCQSAPAPFYDTAENHWLGETELLCEIVAAHVLFAVEEVSYECASCTWVGSRSEWEEEEWHIESCR